MRYKRFARQETKDAARWQRNHASETYRAVWEVLRRKRLGIKFRRKTVMFGWIVDFYCPKLQLALVFHDPSSRRIRERTMRSRVLRSKGFSVLHIERDPESVAQKVSEFQKGFSSLSQRSKGPALFSNQIETP